MRFQIAPHAIEQYASRTGGRSHAEARAELEELAERGRFAGKTKSGDRYLELENGYRAVVKIDKYDPKLETIITAVRPGGHSDDSLPGDLGRGLIYFSVEVAIDAPPEDLPRLRTKIRNAVVSVMKNLERSKPRGAREVSVTVQSSEP